jgi:two-component system, cell cycle response regulator
VARILVVDDDRFFAQLCQDLLKSDGHQVTTVFSAEEAIELLGLEKFELVITDLVMPGKSGLELLAMVKEADPTIDVIIVTGNADVESAIAALKNNARDYLVKPYNPDEFRHMIALCVEQRRLIEENTELKEILNLFQLGQSLTGCIDFERLYLLLTESLAKALRAERVIGMFAGPDAELLPRFQRGFTEGEGRKIGKLFSGLTLKGRDGSCAYERVSDLTGLECDPTLDLREALVIYIRARKTVQGFVMVFNAPGSGLPEAINYKLLDILLDQSTLAFENALRYRAMNSLVYIDELTGLFNYRYLEVTLERETKRVKRYGSSLSLVFLDMDNFKGVNDTHGHRIGSLVLKEVGALLKKQVRDIDVVIRYGGDEFTLLLAEAGMSEAALVSERTRRAIEAYTFGATEGLAIRISASFGYACYPLHTTSKQNLLEMADQAMYRGKENGRNRVFPAVLPGVDYRGQ